MDFDEDSTATGRNLGISYTEGSGYLTENDDTAAAGTGATDSADGPDSDDSDVIGRTRDLGGEAGAGDSRVGLGGVLGTDIVDPSARRSDTFNAADLERIGDNDVKTQEAVYQQYADRDQQT